MTEEELMRHIPICQMLEAMADLNEHLQKAQSLLDDLERSSGARAALEAKVAELQIVAISRAIHEEPEATPMPLPEPQQPPWNGRGVLWGVLFSMTLWYVAYAVTAAIVRRFA